MKWLERAFVEFFYGPRPKKTAMEYRIAARQARPYLPEVAKFFDRQAHRAARFEALD